MTNGRWPTTASLDPSRLCRRRRRSHQARCPNLDVATEGQTPGCHRQGRVQQDSASRFRSRRPQGPTFQGPRFPVPVHCQTGRWGQAPHRLETARWLQCLRSMLRWPAQCRQSSTRSWILANRLPHRETHDASPRADHMIQSHDFDLFMSRLRWRHRRDLGTNSEMIRQSNHLHLQQGRARP
jgi:hypothetical protein